MKQHEEAYPDAHFFERHGATKIDGSTQDADWAFRRNIDDSGQFDNNIEMAFADLIADKSRLDVKNGQMLATEIELEDFKIGTTFDRSKDNCPTKILLSSNWTRKFDLYY